VRAVGMGRVVIPWRGQHSDSGFGIAQENTLSPEAILTARWPGVGLLKTFPPGFCAASHRHGKPCRDLLVIQTQSRRSYRKRIAAETELARQKQSIAYIQRGGSPLSVLPSHSPAP
jgi:hypothetical protein